MAKKKRLDKHTEDFLEKYKAIVLLWGLVIFLAHKFNLNQYLDQVGSWVVLLLIGLVTTFIVQRYIIKIIGHRRFAKLKKYKIQIFGIRVSLLLVVTFLLKKLLF